MASTIAVALIVFTGGAAMAARGELNQPTADRDRRQLWNVFLLLAAVATALMWRPSSIVWQLLPKLRFVQFPWRWMSILTVPFVHFLGAAFSRQRFRWLWIIAVASLITGPPVYLTPPTWWYNEEFTSLRATIPSADAFNPTAKSDPIADH